MHIINANVHASGSWLLAIDTSSEQVGLALTDGTATAELTWPAGRQHTTVLIAAIASLFGRMQRSVSDLGAIGVAVGPGTFNGLRAGIGTAKGLALGAELPIIGVGTLAATVWPVLAPERVAVGVAAAGRGRVVWARFRPAADDAVEPEALGAATNGPIDDMAAAIRGIAEPVTIAGELAPAQVTELRTALAGRDVWMPAGGSGGRRPAAVAELALARWRRGETDALDTLDAVYLHSAARPPGGERRAG